jgi:hypothetical protein
VQVISGKWYERQYGRQQEKDRTGCTKSDALYLPSGVLAGGVRDSIDNMSSYKFLWLIAHMLICS